MDTIFVGHESAFAYWSHARARETRECRPAGIRSLVSATASASAVHLARQLSPLVSGLPSPLHVMVGTQSHRLRSRDVVAHSCEASLPPHSFCTLDADGYIASPELTLMQYARTVPTWQFLREAYALCGTYALDPTDTRGFVDRLPITSVQRLRAFARAASSLQGVVALRKALPYLANGSASPQETILALALCLPQAQGGYGLPVPLLNEHIVVAPRLRSHVEKDWYMPDLYWPSHHLAVEYNSTAFHTGAQNIANDSKRAKDFAVLGIELLTVTWHEVHDQVLTDRVAQRIARALGKRLRPRTSAQAKACRMLRAQIMPQRPSP